MASAEIGPACIEPKVLQAYGEGGKADVAPMAATRVVVVACPTCGWQSQFGIPATLTGVSSTQCPNCSTAFALQVQPGQHLLPLGNYPTATGTAGLAAPTPSPKPVERQSLAATTQPQSLAAPTQAQPLTAPPQQSFASPQLQSLANPQQSPLPCPQQLASQLQQLQQQQQLVQQQLVQQMLHNHPLMMAPIMPPQVTKRAKLKLREKQPLPAWAPATAPHQPMVQAEPEYPAGAVGASLCEATEQVRRLDVLVTTLRRRVSRLQSERHGLCRMRDGLPEPEPSPEDTGFASESSEGKSSLANSGSSVLSCDDGAAENMLQVASVHDAQAQVGQLHKQASELYQVVVRLQGCNRRLRHKIERCKNKRGEQHGEHDCMKSKRQKRPRREKFAWETASVGLPKGLSKDKDIERAMSAEGDAGTTSSTSVTPPLSPPCSPPGWPSCKLNQPPPRRTTSLVMRGYPAKQPRRDGAFPVWSFPLLLITMLCCLGTSTLFKGGIARDMCSQVGSLVGMPVAGMLAGSVFFPDRLPGHVLLYVLGMSLAMAVSRCHATGAEAVAWYMRDAASPTSTSALVRMAAIVLSMSGSVIRTAFLMSISRCYFWATSRALAALNCCLLAVTTASCWLEEPAATPLMCSKLSPGAGIVAACSLLLMAIVLTPANRKYISCCATHFLQGQVVDALTNSKRGSVCASG
eukprot:CAMPEP_0119063624 /NCGR_PEP_ID=MMETSP1178-20130426/6906_1 /TAXON_ID=33656 /ORGANISM="unid sp, Strain CCMP2000" /LENGTH=691 /DNA_ID=CAMNT_0007044997 /DNA_START=21 /DNA_END=2096 /DNA_ORIENTATION=+